MIEQDITTRKLCKLKTKRQVLFRAFFLNLILVCLVWLFTKTALYTSLMVWMAPEFATYQGDLYMMMLIGAWDIAGVVFFLVPALATWWQEKTIK